MRKLDLSCVLRVGMTQAAPGAGYFNPAPKSTQEKRILLIHVRRALIFK